MLSSSFDHAVKLWDVRVPSVPLPQAHRQPHHQQQQHRRVAAKPVFEVRNEVGNVMVAWAPDDTRFLVSSIDNRVRQFSTLTGNN